MKTNKRELLLRLHYTLCYYGQLRITSSVKKTTWQCWNIKTHV